jgi:hypothetical protein
VSPTAWRVVLVLIVVTAVLGWGMGTSVRRRSEAVGVSQRQALSGFFKEHGEPGKGGSTSDDRCLIVALRPERTLAISESVPSSAFRLGEREYRRVGTAQFTGFYDWLRDSSGSILGVRYAPLPDDHPGDKFSQAMEGLGGGTITPKQVEELAQAVGSLSYTAVDRGKIYEIFFTSQRTYDEAHSADQAFIYSMIYQSDDGEYALVFGLEALDAEQAKRLRGLGVRWETPR